MMPSDVKTGAEKFDPARADEYAAQSRIALAGYDACHELAACLLAASIGTGSKAHILVAGAGGTGNEIIAAGTSEPLWQFTAIDPSKAMLDLAVEHITKAGFGGRTVSRLGLVDDMPAAEKFDAATLIGVLHHLPGDDAKLKILDEIAARLKPGAPLVLACNRYSYASRPLFLAAWQQRWRLHGASAEQAQAKLATILGGADPPESDEAVAAFLARSGFEAPIQFFSSLFWGAWIARRMR
jgi:tRNA (cmo5U34)-methyltransferase